MNLRFDDTGVIIVKSNKKYTWDKISKIIGYLIFEYDTDNMIIEISFNDGFVLKFDDNNSVYHLLTNVLANQLDNFNTKWYEDIHSSIEERKVVEIFSNSDR